MDLSKEIEALSQAMPEPQSNLTEGHIRAIVGMYANGTPVPKLASFYNVSQAEIRSVLRPYVSMQADG